MSRILLLEDDDALIDGLQYALRKRGYEIVAARSVGEAKKCLRQGFDLLLLDVSLPDGTGFEVCENIRESGDGTPVIFLTAADDEMSVVRGLDGGGDDYVTKPFRLGELCSRIHALLRRAGVPIKDRRYRDRPAEGKSEAGRQGAGTDGSGIPSALSVDPERRNRCDKEDDSGRTVGQRRKFCGR